MYLDLEIYYYPINIPLGSPEEAPSGESASYNNETWDFFMPHTFDQSF